MKNIIFCLFLLLGGCATAASQGRLNNVEFRKFVILGEQVSSDTAVLYANKFNAKVFYTPSRGAIAAGVVKGLTGTLGPSSAMKSLMNDFRSMSNTSGEWEIVVPNIAERYVLVALRNMENGAVVNAKGKFYLCESKENSAFVSEVKRVFGDGFNVEFAS